jgi:SNF2 family DNA or RNA helicase/DNA polymerase III epsilon subunit-like protein
MSGLNIFKRIFTGKNNIGTEDVTFKSKFLKDRIEIFLDGSNGRVNLNEYLKNYTDKELEYFKEALIFQIDIEKNVIILDYEDIYNLGVNELNYFSLPEYFKGIIDIKNRGPLLNREKFQFELNFYDLQNRNESYDYIAGNYYVTNSDTGKNFFLEKKQMELINKINRFNLENKSSSDPDSQFELIEEIQKASEEIYLTYSEQLNEFSNLETVDNLQIDFEKIEGSEGKLEVLPRIESFSENENKILQKKFREAKRINQFYELEVEGKSIKLVFNKKLKKALEVLKEEPIIDEKEFVTRGSKLFTDERLEQEEIEILYGPRVKGLGYLNYRSNSAPNNSEINWVEKDFPYIQAETDRIQLRPEDIEELRKGIEKTPDGEPIIINIDGNKIIIPTKEDVENEIQRIESSIIDFTKLKKVKDIQELIDFFEVNPEAPYYSKNGFYIKKPNNIELLYEYVESLGVKEVGNDREKPVSLIDKSNIDELEHAEELNSPTENSFNFIRPKTLKNNINLYPHQEEGVAKLQNLYSLNSINGVLLADDMGLGKTIQILTFLAWLKEEKIKEGYLKSLIVMPTSLINNWNFESSTPEEEGEIQKFFEGGTFKVTTFKGKLSKERVDDLNYSDIVITSYESLRLNHVQTGKIKWNVIICDEAQKIKNPTTLVTTAVKTQNADFKIACSATPIENTSEDLWCLVDFVKPGLLGSLKSFKGAFSKPIINNQSRLEVIEELNNNLKGKIDNFYIRRIKDVLNTDGKFPDKIIKYYNSLPSSKQGVKFEEAAMQSYDSGNILATIQYLLMISSHPELANGTELITNGIKELEEESSKIPTLKRILEIVRKKQEKAIIFTKYKKMQKIISILLNTWYKLSPSIINGEININKRKEALDLFKKSQGFDVIILSPEAAGVGLNITEANHVIHYTRHWNPAKEEQATDRAYRIGQTKDVYVHYPILSYNEGYPEVVTYDLDSWVDEELERSLENSTPEEKLNHIIMKKKKMLKDFFLATPLDVDASDFVGVMTKPGFRSEFNGKRSVVFFDLETNGLTNSFSVLSITAYKGVVDSYSREVEIVDKYIRYYYPVEPYSPRAIEVNKLTKLKVDELRKKAGYSKHFKDDFSDLYKFIGDTNHFVAHKISFDREFMGMELRNQFCTMLSNTDIIKLPKKNGGYKWPRLFEAALYYNVPVNISELHDSTYDVEIMVEVFKKMYEGDRSNTMINNFLSSK